ncbi:MAG: VanW family protein [Clostridia bacterium]|nr:VanW family protein [Clostridia bacterium]
MDKEEKIIEPTVEENKELHMPAEFEKESAEESIEKTQQIKFNVEPAPAEQEVNIPEAELDRIAEPAPELRTSKKSKKPEPEPEPESEDDDDYEYEYYEERPRSVGGRILKAVIITLVVLLIFGALGLGGYTLYHVYFYSQVYEGVWIDKIDFSGYTKQEVLAELDHLYSEVPAGEDLDIVIGDKTYTFEIAGNISYDVRATADRIIQYGRKGSFGQRIRDILEAMRFGYEMDFSYSTTDHGIETQIQRVAAEVEQDVIKASYAFDGTRVLIDRGQNGLTLDRTRLLTFIKNRLYTGDFSPAIFELEVTATNTVDLMAIKTEVEQELRQPTLDPANDAKGRVVLPGVKGIYFDATAAQETLDNAGNQRIVEIPVQIVQPDYTDDEYMALVFHDELSRVDTALTQNANRTTNVLLAAKFCNDVILMPGETFSFNKTVGERTAARGFKEATVYTGASAEDGLGGGICQVSSALYYCAIRFDLEIVERYAHSRMVTYVPAAQDAAVAWGYKDFQFKNNTQWPVKIVALYDETNHQLDVTFLGTDLEPNKVVDIETVITSKTPFNIVYQGNAALKPGESYQSAGGYTGYKAEAYRVEYVDGVEASRSLVNKSTYYKYDRVIQVSMDSALAGTSKTEWQPDDPYIPVDPSPIDPPPEPDLPVEPDTPSDPNIPSTPDTPTTPGTPDTPSNPTEPDAPATPDTPVIPSVSPGDVYTYIPTV